MAISIALICTTRWACWEGACTTQFRVNFGPIVPLDYNKDGHKEHIFVVTQGGLGNIQPATVEQERAGGGLWPGCLHPARKKVMATVHSFLG